MSEQSIQFDQRDAITLAGSALILMFEIRLEYWRLCRMRLCRERQDRPGSDDEKYYAELIEREEGVMRELCEHVDAAMQFIGDCNNSNDAADYHGMTDAAFAAMDRALGRERAGPQRPA